MKAEVYSYFYSILIEELGVYLHNIRVIQRLYVRVLIHIKQWQQ